MRPAAGAEVRDPDDEVPRVRALEVERRARSRWSASPRRRGTARRGCRRPGSSRRSPACRSSRVSVQRDRLARVEHEADARLAEAAVRIPVASVGQYVAWFPSVARGASASCSEPSPGGGSQVPTARAPSGRRRRLPSALPLPPPSFTPERSRARPRARSGLSRSAAARAEPCAAARAARIRAARLAPAGRPRTSNNGSRGGSVDRAAVGGRTTVTSAASSRFLLGYLGEAGLELAPEAPPSQGHAVARILRERAGDRGVEARRHVGPALEHARRRAR